MMVILTLAEWIGSMFLISLSVLLIGFGLLLMVVAVDMFREKMEEIINKNKGE
jgi:small neutral amino acid transporter SnatA (MarC family)|tara:strand:- start:565 stop:723 length:159 start_codon:yes stop_codon:yes gene_type:complete